MIRKLWSSIKPYNINDQRRKDMIEFEGIIRASYRPNVGQVLPGEIPVIAPRVEDFLDEMLCDGERDFVDEPNPPARVVMRDMAVVVVFFVAGSAIMLGLALIAAGAG